MMRPVEAEHVLREALRELDHPGEADKLPAVAESEDPATRKTLTAGRCASLFGVTSRESTSVRCSA